MKVLVIEDDPEIIETLTFAFNVGWPEVNVVSTKHGEEGIRMVEAESPAIIILDLGLPDVDGFTVLEQIRLSSQVPVVILSVSGEEESVIKGLELGADEYIVKPFRPLELMARIKKILKIRNLSHTEPSLDYGWLRLDVLKREVNLGGKVVQLTGTEMLLLHHLALNLGIAIDNRLLAERVWGGNYPGYGKAIRVYIRRLRQKLEKDANNPQLILTRPGAGYMLAKQS
jgi:DNA-binding response OmpR family regulator